MKTSCENDIIHTKYVKTAKPLKSYTVITHIYIQVSDSNHVKAAKTKTQCLKLNTSVNVHDKVSYIFYAKVWILQD